MNENEIELKLYVFWTERKIDKYFSNYFTFAENIGNAVRMAIAYENHVNGIEMNEDYKIRIDIDSKNIQIHNIVLGQVDIKTTRLKEDDEEIVFQNVKF